MKLGDIMLIDTHCHIDSEGYENPSEVIKNMKNNIINETNENDKKEKSHPKKIKLNLKWPLKILFITLCISFCFSILSELLLSNSQSLIGTIISLLLLIFFINIVTEIHLVFCYP